MEDATTDEVVDCRWITVSEIRKLYEDNRLVVEDKWIVSLNREDIAEEKILGDILLQEYQHCKRRDG